MTDRKRLVLDANILLRAVFGRRVRTLLDSYEQSVAFYTADVCFVDALRHIPSLAAKRNFDPASGMGFLEQIARIVESVDSSLYKGHEAAAHERISSRDVEDWPIVATALLLNCPIWTEDQDFFGSGVATWTTNNVELYLREA